MADPHSDDDSHDGRDEPVDSAALTDEESIRKALINKLGKARSQRLGKAKDRLELLVQIAKDSGKCLNQACAKDNDMANALIVFIDSIKDACSKQYSVIRHWTGVKVATKLLEFYDFILKGDAHKKSKDRSKKEPAFVTELRGLVGVAEKELQVDADKAPKSMVKKISRYRSGAVGHGDSLLIDAIPAGITCPFCAKDGHQPTLVLVDHDENRRKMAENEATYEAELEAFNNLPASRRSKAKPKCNVVKQMVACVCSVNHYRGNADGKGCSECSGRRAADPFFVAGPANTCLTCSCICAAFFPLDEVNNVAKYLKDEKDGILEESVGKEGTFKLTAASNF
jgi:hypothetical protein